MKNLKRIIAALAASFMVIIPLAAGCAGREGDREEQEQVREELHEDIAENSNPGIEEADSREEKEPDKEENEIENSEPEIHEEPVPKVVSYFTVTADGVNIRSGAGTSYSVRGQAEKSTLYCLSDVTDGWYGTGYRNKSGYISGKYCTVVNMPASGNQTIEAVIEEGCKLLGTPYVYGATRLHDGKGNMYKSFTTDKFDCSSLMQYIFYKGAGKLLDVNTRTQVYQGTTVTRAQLKRGDLMFFTNAERKNKSGVERIGHVALYLGDNYILHTASDYAKIEQISSTRWSYFIQGQRII